MTERLGDHGDSAIRGGPVARRDVGAHDRRPRRVDARPKSLVDQFERRLHGCPARRRPPEDLADRLDRLDIRLDRQFQPGTRVARARA
jgi:hypothetical protein